jgi:1-acyl-sn-glycerol-3-phosphate acyltransferase
VQRFASIQTLLRSLFGVPLLCVALVGYSAVALVLALAGAGVQRVQPLYLSLSRLFLRIGSTRLEVRGAENIDSGRAYVLVCNHESGWDPFCIIAGLPQLLIRFVAKQELTRIPVFGAALLRTGNLKVVRSDTSGDARRLREGMEGRDPSVSILFFAEGTRSRDGSFGPFKTGAFVTAIGYGLPVLPIALAGTFAVWPKRTARLRSAPVVLEVGTPIETTGLVLADRNRLRDQSREAVAALRERAKARLAERSAG